MTSRDKMLDKIRSRLGAQASDQTRKFNVTSRLEAKASNTIPAKGSLQGNERVEWFKQNAAEKGVMVQEASDRTVLTELLLVLAPNGTHATSNVQSLNLGVQFLEWNDRGSIESCVSTCYCAIAETGTLALVGDDTNPTSQIFLSDRHIVLLPISVIEDCMESVWQRMNTDNILPRHLTFVSGPSSTGDIELQMERGVHGPRELHIILLTFDL